MRVIDVEDASRYEMIDQLHEGPERDADFHEDEDDDDEMGSGQDTVLDSKSVAIQDGVDEEYLAQNLYDYGLEGSLMGALELSNDGPIEAPESPVENDVRYVNLRITNTSKQVQMRKRLS